MVFVSCRVTITALSLMEPVPCNEIHPVVADSTKSHTVGTQATICTSLAHTVDIHIVLQTGSDAAGSAVLWMSLPGQYLYWFDLSRDLRRNPVVVDYGMGCNELHSSCVNLKRSHILGIFLRVPQVACRLQLLLEAASRGSTCHDDKRARHRSNRIRRMAPLQTCRKYNRTCLASVEKSIPPHRPEPDAGVAAASAAAALDDESAVLPKSLLDHCL